MIMLDGRSGRDPAVPDKFGACRGSETRMLSGDQWTWLEEELNKESEVKIIVSGIQVKDIFKFQINTVWIIYSGTLRLKISFSHSSRY